jgi:hypothetical protein
MKQFLVATGIVLFKQEAEDPRDAIARLKARIDARRNEHFNPEIGMSLVEGLDAHSLNFIVMDKDRTQLLAGELNWFESDERMSRYEETVTRRLANAMRYHLPETLYYTTDHTTA